MERMLRTAVLWSAFPAIAAAQGPGRKPIEGTWKVVEVVVTGANPSTNPNPQPGLFSFGQKHYSIMWITSSEPRPLTKGAQPTDEERLRAGDAFQANAGTYEVSGSTITTRPMVALAPNFMAGGSNKYQFRVEGNNLWLTVKSSDLHTRIGEQVVPRSGPAFEIQFKLVRLE